MAESRNFNKNGRMKFMFLIGSNQARDFAI